MPDETIVRELGFVKDRCQELLTMGHLSGVRNPGQTALHMAVIERLNEMAGNDLVELLREGLDEALAERNRNEIRELARSLLVSRAGDYALD